MPNKYLNLAGTDKIKDTYDDINAAFASVEADFVTLETKVDDDNLVQDERMDEHVSGTAERHSSDDIDNDSEIVTGDTVTDAIDAVKNQLDAAVLAASNANIGVFSMNGTGVDTITATYATLTYFTGLKVRLTTAGTNTTAATLNINSLGAKSIKVKDRSGTKSSLLGGEMPSIADLEYDGTDFVLLNSQVASYTTATTSTAQIIPLSSTALKSRLDVMLSGNTQTPYDQYTKFLFLAEGADASTPATDSTGKALTWAGNAQLDTAQYRYGTSSILLDGTGDYVTVDASDGSLDIGTQDFCIEFPVRFASVANTQRIFDFRQAASGDVAPTMVYDVTSGKIIYRVGTTDRITGTSTIVINTWYNIALSRASGVTTLRINGGQEGSSYTDANNYIAVTSIRFGNNYAGSDNSINGWLDHPRISVGTPRYTSNYTPLPMSVLSSDKMRILSVGKNLFDGKLIFGDLSLSDGSFSASTTGTMSESFIRVQPSTAYYVSGLNNNGGNSNRVLYYGTQSYSNYIGHNAVVNGATFTTPSNCFFIKIKQGYNSVSNASSIMVEKGSVATTYVPYTSTSSIVPVELKKISATVYDWADANTGKVTKNISDLTTMSGNAFAWTFSVDYSGFKSIRTDAALTNVKAASSAEAQAGRLWKSNLKECAWASTATSADNFSTSTSYLNLSVADADSGWDEAWVAGTSFTGMTWANLIKAYMNGWKLTTANVDVASCVWTGIASGTVKNAGAADYAHVIANIDVGFTPYKMIYQLATPVVTNYLPSILTAEPSGRVVVEPFVADYDFYDGGCVVTDTTKPIDALVYVNIVNKTNGALTPVAISTCTVAAGGLSFTSTAATAEDLIDYGFTTKDVSTVPDVTYSYANNLKAAVDGNVKDIQLLDNKIEQLTALERSRLKVAPITLGTIDATKSFSAFIAPTACDLVDIKLVTKDAITANDTNYWTITAVDKGSAGSDSNTIVTKTTKVTGGTGIGAYDAYELGALDGAHSKLAAGDVVLLTFTKSASATAFAEALAMITYIEGN